MGAIDPPPSGLSTRARSDRPAANVFPKFGGVWAMGRRGGRTVSRVSRCGSAMDIRAPSSTNLALRAARAGTILVGLLVASSGTPAWAGPPTLPPLPGQRRMPEAPSPQAAATKPVATKPITAKPVTAKPITAKPITAKPITAKPVAAKPVASVPIAAQPSTAAPSPAPVAAQRPPATPPPYRVTSSKAPPSRTTPKAASASPSLAVTESMDPKPDARTPIPHRGFVVDANVGALGCLGATCAGRHAAEPGVRVGGFIGGNIRGWVSIGVAGGWGTLRPRVAAGSLALDLYGLDSAALMRQFDTPVGNMAPVDFTQLVVQSSTIRTAQAGPLLRVHFVPRGRMTAWVGSGAHYNYLSSTYTTPVGAIDLDMHGLAVPVQGGIGVYLARNVAFTAQFDYLWTWYAVAQLRSPQQDLTIPVSMLDDAGRDQGADFADDLPQFWTVAFGLRARV